MVVTLNGSIIFFFRQWEDAEMLYLLQQMYTDLNLIELFNIEVICQFFILKFCSGYTFIMYVTIKWPKCKRDFMDFHCVTSTIYLFLLQMPILQNFLFEVFRNYNATPFHNFRHAFCVTQMVRSGWNCHCLYHILRPVWAMAACMLFLSVFYIHAHLFCDTCHSTSLLFLPSGVYVIIHL